MVRKTEMEKVVNSDGVNTKTDYKILVVRLK